MAGGTADTTGRRLFARFGVGRVERAGRDEIDDVKVCPKSRVDFTSPVVSQTAGQRFFHSPTDFAIRSVKINK